MRHPDQMERLREEPERARDAINEVLRYDSPVQTDFRIAKREAVIGGRTIRTGEGVILLTGSANRDEAAFSEPDRLEITRTGRKHAAFGHGVHQCIGAELARMETSAVIAAAAARIERITLAGPSPGTGAQRSCEGWNGLRCASNEGRARRTHEAARRGAKPPPAKGCSTRQDATPQRGTRVGILGGRHRRPNPWPVGADARTWLVFSSSRKPVRTTFFRRKISAGLSGPKSSKTGGSGPGSRRLPTT